MSVSQRNSIEVEPLSSIVTCSAMQEGEPFVKCRFQFAFTLYIQLAFGTAGLLHLYLPRKFKASFFHQKME